MASGLSYMGTGIYVDENGVDVFEAGLDRFRHLYESYDEVLINFSGGKDSTICMELALIVAEEMGLLPVKMIFYDEEIIDPDTIQYLFEVQDDPRIELHWLCVKARHTLASMKRPYWFTWDEDYRDVWVREMPDYAIKGYEGSENYLDLNSHTGYYTKSLAEEGKTYATVLGIRIEESFNRRRGLTSSGDWYFHRSYSGFQLTISKLIFDWTWQDVWKAITGNNWQYSGYYDKLWLVGYNPQFQRVAPWGNASSVRETRFYQQFYPEFYNKVLERLPEIHTAARYGDTRLYTVTEDIPPKGMLWSEYALYLIAQIEDETIKTYWYKTINQEVKAHKKKYTYSIPETEYLIDDKKSNRCWKQFCRWIKKGDLMIDPGGDIRSRSRF